MSYKRRKIIGWFSVAVGISGVLFFGLQVLFDSDLDTQIQKNRTLETEFRAAADLVDAFRAANGRYPSEGEFSHNLNELKIANPGAFALNTTPTDDPEFLKEMPIGSYYLWYWRGEWEEIYAGWNRKSTLKFSKDELYYLGSAMLTKVVTILSILLICWGFYFKKSRSTNI